MNSKLLFLAGCIPARLILAYLPQKLSPENLKLFGIVLVAISIGFLYLYSTGGRMNAPEAGGYTWWHEMRLIHGMLYTTAAIYAFRGSSYASIPLVIDVVFGLILFLHHHYLSK